jgi:hypothetical protein
MALRYPIAGANGDNLVGEEQDRNLLTRPVHDF